MNIEINRDGCVSCGLCVSICPEVYRIADDGLAEVYSKPTDDLKSKVAEAAENCPVNVIMVNE